MCPPRCFFRGPERWKSVDAKSGLYIGCFAALSSTLLQLGCQAGGMGFWHQVPSVIWGSILVVTNARLMWMWKKLSDFGSILLSFLVFTVVPFAKTRILCWRHILKNVWTFNVTMWISRPFFSFLMRNVILNKKLPNKQMFTRYSYFSVNSCTFIPADACYFPTLCYRIWCISKWNSRNIHLLFMWLVLIGSTLLTMWSFELKECGRNFFLWRTVVDAQGFLSWCFVVSTRSRKCLYEGNGFGIFIWLVCKESDYNFLVMSVTLQLSCIWGTKVETLWLSLIS